MCNILLDPSSHTAKADLKILGEFLVFMKENFFSGYRVSESQMLHAKHVYRTAEELVHIVQMVVLSNGQVGF